MAAAGAANHLFVGQNAAAVRQIEVGDAPQGPWAFGRLAVNCLVGRHLVGLLVLSEFEISSCRRLKREQAEALLRLGIRQTGETLVYGREDGEPKLPGSLTGEFACLTRRMKDLPPVRFHDLRHSHATQLLADGVHPKIAQERLGHSSITTTMDLYSHVTDTMQADAAARLDAAFRPAITSRVAK